jgi:hypothetical protein
MEYRKEVTDAAGLVRTEEAEITVQQYGVEHRRSRRINSHGIAMKRSFISIDRLNFVESTKQAVNWFRVDELIKMDPGEPWWVLVLLVLANGGRPQPRVPIACAFAGSGGKAYYVCCRLAPPLLHAMKQPSNQEREPSSGHLTSNL